MQTFSQQEVERFKDFVKQCSTDTIQIIDGRTCLVERPTDEEVKQFLQDSHKRLLEEVMKEIPGDKPETSMYSTADLINVSSTDLSLERNKGFNKCREQMITNLKNKFNI